MDKTERGIAMKIEIIETDRKVADKYTVIIGENYQFSMSEYPDRANEINMFIGFIRPLWRYYLTKDEKILSKIPKNLKYAIRERCKQIRANELDKCEED